MCNMECISGLIFHNTRCSNIHTHLLRVMSSKHEFVDVSKDQIHIHEEVQELAHGNYVSSHNYNYNIHP